MAKYAPSVCLSRARRFSRRRDRHGAGGSSTRSDLDRETRDGEPRPRPYRNGARYRDGAWLPDRVRTRHNGRAIWFIFCQRGAKCEGSNTTLRFRSTTCPNSSPRSGADPGIAARVLEFTILTAARTAEVLGACWREIDWAAKVWAIPGERMKAAREHRVPLTEEALRVLETVRPLALLRNGEPDPAAPLFPGPRRAFPLSNMTMLMLLRRMKRKDVTPHGFRSTFSDWAAERTAYPREVVEMALAHAIESKVEAAYRRGDLFAKRRGLMVDWSAFCSTVAPTDVA